MYRHIDDVGPNDYPIALSGFGADAPPADPRSGRLWVRMSDLEAFGLLTATEKFFLNGLLQSGKLADAETIIIEKEKKAASRSPKFNIVSKVDANLPPGLKVRDELIKNVPNFVLYGGAGIFGILILRALMRKK